MGPEPPPTLARAAALGTCAPLRVCSSLLSALGLHRGRMRLLRLRSRAARAGHSTLERRSLGVCAPLA
eukprot:3321007-Lingulodinium_polyedra.AAC.1